MSSAPDRATLAVLDPARSGVVEACAGSGKTWLLAARIVRLLLAGAGPSEILAITFTRKAAREIEERVVDWLRWLATADAEAARAFLVERGAGVDMATLDCARGLYERLLIARPPLAVNTFHGWFLQLKEAAPLSANLSGTTLVEEGSRHFDEVWQGFAASLQRHPAGTAAQSFVRLLAGPGLAATRQLMRSGMARRTDWLAHISMASGATAEPLGAVLDGLHALFGADDETAVLADFFASGWDADFHAYLGFLDASELDSDLRFAQMLAGALPGSDDAVDQGERFASLARVLLTEQLTLRSRKPSNALDKRFGVDGAARFLDLHAALGERLLTCLRRRREARNFTFNRDALTVYQAFLEHLARFKSERRQIDFVDAEWEVQKLLADEQSAAFVQARLDARYRHVLLDEFQDTNPLQWRILLAWLDAYTDAARPTVFLVGDPKQSIYRFRGAEPRLFGAASSFLRDRFAAASLEKDETRRNAPAIIDVVNALFSTEAAFAPFRTQLSSAAGVPGRVELLPLCEAPAPENSEEDKAAGVAALVSLRNPLREAVVEVPDRRREQEAVQLAARLAQMIGRTMIRDAEAGCAGERPLRAGDILLLVRTRTNIALYEKALAAQGIPYAAASRGGLLQSLEVRDMVALLEFLVTPAADLSLAHVLKSPLFACSDDDLLRLAAGSESAWWARLTGLILAGDGSPALRRAARLLGAWLEDAARLPAHDLLDRIYGEGEVIARYRLAVPEARRDAALANLEALLFLALDVNGGRYPSLSRFINELKILRRAGDDDAPDEGELASDEVLAADGRVRILTIHGAKGLEAPLVWLLDANAAPRGDSAWGVLSDWPPEAPAPTHFSFVGRKDERGESRAAIFTAQAAAEAREELNLLYVALTRAKQLFLCSGIDNGRAKAATAYVRIASALQRLGSNGAYGQELPTVDAVAAEPPAMPSPVAALASEVEPVGQRRESPDAAARFGILLHALLERRTESRESEGWWREMGYSDADMRRVRPVAERVLNTAILRRFFDPACFRKAWNEMEISDATGAVLRIDRLVELDEAMWVLDYKSSGAATERMEDYCSQVAGYCRAVAGIFVGKPVRGALVFADGGFVEVKT